jgi:hypothetical protein
MFQSHPQELRFYTPNRSRWAKYEGGNEKKECGNYPSDIVILSRVFGETVRAGLRELGTAWGNLAQARYQYPTQPYKYVISSD